jgi:hypothetical protein
MVGRQVRAWGFSFPARGNRLIANGYQQLPLTQAAAESGNSVITSMVVAAPTTKAKVKTVRAKILFMVVIPFLQAYTVPRFEPGRCD